MMALFVSQMLFLIKWKLLSVSCLHPLYLWSNLPLHLKVHDVLYSVRGTREIYVRLVIAVGFQHTNLQDTCNVVSRNSCASWAIS